MRPATGRAYPLCGQGRAPQDDGEDCDCGAKFTTCTKPHDDDDGHYRITLGESIGELLRDSRPRDRRGGGEKRRRCEYMQQVALYSALLFAHSQHIE